MAFNYSPKIITDGLVLYLDAANTRSYPGSGTVWSDLSRGGNNGTLTNGPTFNSGNGGSIVFDGVNDSSNSTVINLSSNFSVSSWIYPTSLKNAAIVSNGFAWVYYSGWSLDIQNTNSFGLYFNRNGGYRYSLNNLLITNSWNYISAAYTRSTGDIKLYLNGIETLYKSSSLVAYSTQYLQTNILGIGYNDYAAYSPGNYFQGRISNAQIYNRALSAQEILQNYNATKSRFGL
jgi:hypothetical protein